MSKTKTPAKKRLPGNHAMCTCAGIRRAARVVTQMYDAALRPVGLTSTQFTLLAVLSEMGGLALSRVAEVLDTDRTTLNRNLKPLIAEGLIADARGDDRRQRLLELTAAGRARLAAAEPLWNAAQGHMVAAMGRNRWASLLDGLDAAVDAARVGNGP